MKRENIERHRPPNNSIKNQVFKPVIEGWKHTIKDIEEAMESDELCVLARIFFVYHYADLRMRQDSHSSWQNAKDKLPLAALLDSGKRVTIELPPSEKPHEFFYWLATGEKMGENHLHDVIGFSFMSDRQKPIYRRGFATHTVTQVDKNKGLGRHYKERKVRWWRGSMHLFSSPLDQSHFGMNIGYAGEDADGEHGHIYFHYKAPTKTKSGAMLISCETSAPGKKNHQGKRHGVFAGSSRTTISGIPKPEQGKIFFRDHSTKKQHYVEGPGNYDCLHAKLDSEKFGEIKTAYRDSKNNLGNLLGEGGDGMKSSVEKSSLNVWQHFFDWLQSLFRKTPEENNNRRIQHP